MKVAPIASSAQGAHFHVFLWARELKFKYQNYLQTTDMR
jgi:hypothetical protein